MSASTEAHNPALVGSEGRASGGTHNTEGELPGDVYLDNCSTTRIDGSVVDAMLPFLRGEKFFFSREEIRGEEQGYVSTIKNLLHCCEDDKITLTSSATESCNQVIKAMHFAPKNCHNRLQIITALSDHPSVTQACRFVQELGAPVLYLPCKLDGYVEVESLRRFISGTTLLVSVNWASSITGVINPIEELCQVAHENGALFHIDGVQGIGKLPFSFSSLGADFMSISGHKIYGPNGTGLLVTKDGRHAMPLIHGEYQNELNRGGITNLPGLVGITEALKIASRTQPYVDSEVRRMRDEFEAALTQFCQEIHSEITIIGAESPRLPNISFVSFGPHHKKVLNALSSHRIHVSGFTAPGSIKVTGIRFSLSKDTHPDHITSTLNVIKDSLAV